MKTYVINCYGQYNQDHESEWAFALDSLCYTLHQFSVYSPNEDKYYFSFSKDPNPFNKVGMTKTEHHVGTEDSLIFIKTDAPVNVVEALWSMTSRTCGVVGWLPDGADISDFMLGCYVYDNH